MRIIIGLGGNALLKRGERISAAAQHRNIQIAAAQLAKVAVQHDLVIVHGNGPQIGLLAQQNINLSGKSLFPLDVLDAETEGMLGYIIEQEMMNFLPTERALATLLTMVEVDPADPAFATPNKPIGPLYTKARALTLARLKGWNIAPDGAGYRRVVASPKPKRIVEIRPLRWLLEKHVILICAGGGGIPITVCTEGKREGVEAVIDKDYCAALLACELEADLLVIATDVPTVFADWGQSTQRAILQAHPDALAPLDFAAGTMKPKVSAACEFSHRTQQRAVIGALCHIKQMIDGIAGTSISPKTSGITYKTI
jgi:carbamate kinase